MIEIALKYRCRVARRTRSRRRPERVAGLLCSGIAPDAGLVLRPRQEQVLYLLRDHGAMAPAGIWATLGVSRHRAMDLLRPLLDAGVVEKVGGNKTGRHVLRRA